MDIVATASELALLLSGSFCILVMFSKSRFLFLHLLLNTIFCFFFFGDPPALDIKKMPLPLNLLDLSSDSLRLCAGFICLPVDASEALLADLEKMEVLV